MGHSMFVNSSHVAMGLLRCVLGVGESFELAAVIPTCRSVIHVKDAVIHVEDARSDRPGGGIKDLQHVVMILVWLGGEPAYHYQDL